MKHINTTIDKMSGLLPKKRVRGSRPDQQLLAIRTHSPNVVCQLTGDSPREYLFKNGTTYSLQQDHIIQYKIVPMWQLDGVKILSPNGHQHITNLENGKREIIVDEFEVCEICKMNNYEYYRRTKLIVTFHTHHIDGNRSNNKISNLVCWCKKCHQDHHTRRDSKGIYQQHTKKV